MICDQQFRTPARNQLTIQFDFPNIVLDLE